MFVSALLITSIAIPAIGELNSFKEISNEKISIHKLQFLDHQTITIRHHFLKRTFLLYVPSTYDEQNPIPLVLMFHGGENTAINASERFGFSEKAEQEGFLVAYPDASELMGDSWNFGLGWYTASYFDELGRWFTDDIGFCKKIIDKLQTEYSIDSNKIYAAGHSNGRMMSYYVAVSISDTFAAIGSCGGCISGHLRDFDLVTIPEPIDPVPIVEFHGEKDREVPYDGGWNSGHSIFYGSVDETINFWVEHNECDTEPITTVNGNITVDLYSNGNEGTEVLLYSVANKGHIWFGGQPWEDADPEISTTDLMWDFFESHLK